MAAPITRRGLVRAAGAAVGAAALPLGIVGALAAETPATGLPTAVPLAFDPAAFVADLKAAGFSVHAMRDTPQPGWSAGRPTYGIGPGTRTTFGGRPYLAVMARWSDAMDACPDRGRRRPGRARCDGHPQPPG